MAVKIYINNKEVSIKEINNWELNRSKKVAYYLQKKSHIPVKDITIDENGVRDIKDVRHELTKLKLNIGSEKIREILNSTLNFTTFCVKLINLLSLKKRKSSIIEMTVKGCNSEEMLKRYFNLMLKNTSKNLELGISANPDHYILRGNGEMVQEVIETTGGSPMPTQFFIYYGNDSGLNSKVDDSYQVQAAGICCLKDGTPIGGVRHQMCDEKDGIRVKLEVEFPALLTKSMIKQHQMHLACEFSNWFNNLTDEEIIAGMGE